MKKPNRLAKNTIMDMVSARNDVLSPCNWNIGWDEYNYVGTINQPIFIPTPDWADRIEGYSDEAFDLNGLPAYDGEKIVVVIHKPSRTLGVGFAKVYITDNGMKKMFPQMRGIWKETKSRMESESEKLDIFYRQNISRCKIDDDGRVSSSFGIPDMQSIMDVVQKMYTIWLDWQQFPNIGEFSIVRTLLQAKRDVDIMQSELSHNRIKGEIESIRKEIQESQNRIVELEKELNDICEKAADAMNLLEENGVKIDLDKNEDDAIAGHYARYSDKRILIDSGSDLSTLPSDTYKLSNDELKEFQKAWVGSYVTIDDSVSTSISSAS